MSKNYQKYVSWMLALLFLFLAPAKGEDEKVELASTAKACLHCHGESLYSFENEMMGLTETKRMNPYFILDSATYKAGEHGTFSCDDCHSPDYSTYPHNAELKLEFKYSCQDCHGGDDTYAHLHFDEIEIEVQNSVHVQKLGDAFKCEMCHDPHTNKLVASSNKYSIPEIVSFNNNMCLSCHMDEVKYAILVDEDQPELMKTHDWLPNQSLHFKNVRCIECHTSRNDTMMVAHNILPKESAIKNCVECHSSNGLLQAKLYKYLNIESRSNEGIASSLRNEAYVIGANRNRALNLISLILFGMVLSGIVVHISFRIIKRK